MLKPIKGHPGRYLDTSSGQVLNISEYREDDKYDTIVVRNSAWTGDAITSGRQYIWFRDIEKKLPIDTNFTQPSRMSMGEEMVLDRVGVSVGMAMGSDDASANYTTGTNADVVALILSGHIRVNVNNLLLTEGPMIKYPCGYGIHGLVWNAGTFVNIGVPSQAAVTKLVKTQTLTDKHEIMGILTFFSREWANWTLGTPHEVGMPTVEDAYFIPIKCWLHGLLKVAVNK